MATASRRVTTSARPDVAERTRAGDGRRAARELDGRRVILLVVSPRSGRASKAIVGVSVARSGDRSGPERPGRLEPAAALAVRERPEPAPRLEHRLALGRRGSAGRTTRSRVPRSGGALHVARGADRVRRSGRRWAWCSRSLFVHSRLLERAFVPYVIASQTIPIIALAPMIVFAFGPGRPGGRRHRDLPHVLPGDDRDDPRPRSFDPRALELMRSYAASPAGRSLEAAPAGLAAVPVHGAEDRGDGAASSARSSARAPAPSRRASGASSRRSTSTTSPARRSSGRAILASGAARDRVLPRRRAAEVLVLRRRPGAAEG